MVPSLSPVHLVPVPILDRIAVLIGSQMPVHILQTEIDAECAAREVRCYRPPTSSEVGDRGAAARCPGLREQGSGRVQPASDPHLAGCVMSAREDLAYAVTPELEGPGADQLIEAFRAEVLAEAGETLIGLGYEAAGQLLRDTAAVVAAPASAPVVSAGEETGEAAETCLYRACYHPRSAHTAGRCEACGAEERRTWQHAFTTGGAS